MPATLVHDDALAARTPWRPTSQDPLAAGFAPVTVAEQEVIIHQDRQDGQAHVCSTWPAWSRKLERLCGSPKKVTQREGKLTSAFWTIPLALVTLRRGVRRVRLSDAQRQAARERLGRARQGRSAPFGP